MQLSEAIRDALEHQIFEHEIGKATLSLRDAVTEHGPEAVATELLDAAAVALRLMVAETDETYDHAELLDRLAFDGAIEADNLDVMSRMLTFAAATAGGIRPPIDAAVAEVGVERALFGAWLAVLATIRVVAISLERTEADLTEEVLGVLGAL
jgi:hypothetical protein